jgi:putative inorganic carbon (HCO3(-)) transporter
MAVSNDVEARDKVLLRDQGIGRINGEPVPGKGRGALVARSLSRIIFYALLLLIFLVAIPYGTVEPWWEALFEFIVFALGALWAVEGMLSGGWLLREHRIFLPVLLLILYAFIQTLPLLPGNASGAGLKVWGAISADPYETRLSVLKLLALTLAGAMLMRYTTTERRLRALIYTLIGVGLASAFFGILRQTTQHSPGFILPSLLPGVGYGQFINRNHFAFLMEMVLGLILGLIVARGVRRDQLLIYLALALPVWAALVLCNSRGGLFGMLAEVFFLALSFSLMGSKREGRGQGREGRGFLRGLSRSAIFRPILIVGLLVTVFLGAILLGGESLTSRLEMVSSEVGAEGSAGNAGAQRAEIWRATWRMIKDHPLLGVGFNGYWAAIPQYHNASGELVPQQAHNDYLELMASGGIIGVVLTGWFLFLLIKEMTGSWRANDSFRRAAGVAASIGLFGVAVHSVVDFGLHVTINALIFTALVVIAVSGRRVEETKAVKGRVQNRELATL